jgi:hypothetical protein
MQLMTGQEAAAQQERLQPRWYIGVDLGQAHDFTAIAVIRETPVLEGKPTYECGHLERFKLDTSYPAMVAAVMDLLTRPELNDRWSLVVDATGVGRPVVDLFKDALASKRSRLKAVTITGGGTATTGAFGIRAPKRDLVMVLKVLLETGRLQFAEGPEVSQLVAEVLAFKVKITAAGNDVYGAWREGSHDDLVLAVSLAAWYAERYGSKGWGGSAW